MAKYCIFGGAGFIGRYLVDLLRAQGHETIVIGQQPRAEQKNYFVWSHLSETSLKVILHGVDGVVNLAYASTPKTSYDNPIDDIRENLPFVINFLEFLSQLSTPRVVMVSTGGAIYGNVGEGPISEKVTASPISPYGITKLAMEKYAMMYHAHKGLPVICLRPGNAYGVGQRPYSSQGFIATATHSVMDGKPMKIFGKQGTIRDHIHVRDVARAIYATLRFGRVGEVYNVGTGKGTSTLEIMNTLSGWSQKDGYPEPVVEKLPIRPFDVLSNVLDSSKLSSHTGWSPKVNLAEGLFDYWQHAKKGKEKLDKVVW